MQHAELTSKFQRLVDTHILSPREQILAGWFLISIQDLKPDPNGQLDGQLGHVAQYCLDQLRHPDNQVAVEYLKRYIDEVPGRLGGRPLAAFPDPTSIVPQDHFAREVLISDTTSVMNKLRIKGVGAEVREYLYAQDRVVEQVFSLFMQRHVGKIAEFIGRRVASRHRIYVANFGQTLVRLSFREDEYYLYFIRNNHHFSFNQRGKPKKGLIFKPQFNDAPLVDFLDMMREVEQEFPTSL